MTVYEDAFDAAVEAMACALANMLPDRFVGYAFPREVADKLLHAALTVTAPCETCEGEGYVWDDMDGGSYDCHGCGNSGRVQPAVRLMFGEQVGRVTSRTALPSGQGVAQLLRITGDRISDVPAFTPVFRALNAEGDSDV